MRAKLVSLLVAAGLLAAGAGTMAIAGNFPQGHSHPSGKSQYCPPKSPQHGKPKKPRPARCGKGPKPGHGHGDDNDNDGNNGDDSHGHQNGHSFKWWYHGHWYKHF